MTTLLFAGLGKGTFLRTSFQHSYLINANSTDLPGTLANTTHEFIQCGFPAFVRLVGVVYFKKHYAAFKYESPCTHLNSFASGVSKEDQHNQWLEDIKATGSDHTRYLISGAKPWKTNATF